MTVIVRDVFPAQLVDPPADLDIPTGRVRAVATVDGTLLLLIESGSGLVRREFRYLPNSPGTQIGEVWSAKAASFQLEDGRILFVKRGGGCGCGSRLRSIEPFPDAGPVTIAG